VPWRDGLGVGMLPSPQAGPAPVLGMLHQVGARGVAFDVAHHMVEMLVFLDLEALEALEAALIDLAVASTIMGMPAHGRGNSKPWREGRGFSVTLRPDDEVPVIGHQAIGE
jgi:hypothetical protein